MTDHLVLNRFAKCGPVYGRQVVKLRPQWFPVIKPELTLQTKLAEYKLDKNDFHDNTFSPVPSKKFEDSNIIWRCVTAHPTSKYT